MAEPKRGRQRRKLDPTEVALFLAMCAVLTIAGAVIVRAMLTGTVPRGAPGAGSPAERSVSVAGVRAEATEGTWRTGPALDVERSEVAAAVIDGTIYVLGGLAQDGRTLQTVEALSPGMERWERRAPLPAPRDHSAAVDLGGRLYVVAGSPGWFGQQTSNTLWVYDASHDTWESRAPLPFGRAAHAATVLDGKLYVAGGIGPESQHMLVYDPEADTWQIKARMSRPREHLAAAATSGKVYAIGGRWGDVGNVNLLEEYDPSADTWRLIAPMPTPRGGLAAAVLDERIYVTGGEVLDNSRATFGQLEVYDPAAGVWSSGPPLPTPRHGLGAVARDNALFVLAGGRQAGLEVSGVVELFTPPTLD